MCPGLRKHIRTIHEGVSYPLTHAERVRRCKQRKISLYSEETRKEMEKVKNQTKIAGLKAKRMENKDFDIRFREGTRERTRRCREKKALQEALAKRTENTFLSPNCV